jgi:hypothetical protein
MAKWTPPLQPMATYELDGQAVDAGETCIAVTRQDGTAIAPGDYQALFNAAIVLNQLMSAVYAALAALQPAVAADTGTGIVTATVAGANLSAAQAIAEDDFAGQPVSVVAGSG